MSANAWPRHRRIGRPRAGAAINTRHRVVALWKLLGGVRGWNQRVARAVGISTQRVSNILREHRERAA